MKLVRTNGAAIVVCGLSAALGCAASQAQGNRRKSPVTVADCIEMRELVAEGYNVGSAAVWQAAQFSPDGERFTILVKKGDLRHNGNKYSLLLFQTKSAFDSPRPEVLVSFTSNSNRPGIEQVRWLDNREIAFLAENLGEVQQLYSIDCNTKRLTRVTNHTTGLVSYAISARWKRVFFLASQPARPLLDRKALRNGFVVTNQNLYDLITGQRKFHIDRNGELFEKDRGKTGETQLRTLETIASGPISLSPNGRYLLLKTFVAEVPELWREYRQDWLRFAANAQAVQGASPMIAHYQLLDIRTGQVHALIDAPVHVAQSDIVWSPDSSSMIMSDICLPLSGVYGRERELRESETFVAEIKIAGRAIVPITSDPLRVLRWDTRSGEILLEPVGSSSGHQEKMVAFKLVAGVWERESQREAGEDLEDPVEITVSEDRNTPPRLFATRPGTGQTSLLLDLNPQFQKLAFGRVEDVTFRATDGHMVKAGLYRPPNPVPGERYPLVIQTHAWNPNKFLIDGPWPSGFAAQPLASRGIVVLQLEEDFSKIATPLEAPEEMAAYEGAIDFLDHLGLVDRSRVGVIGFSRTGFGVKYTLTHSTYHFAAATVADGSDGGYFSYLAFLTSIPINIPDMEGVNGGMPFGEGLRSWLKNSPGFNLLNVTTPVREEAYEPLSLLIAWEWFAGLSRLHKPVELIYLPNASHVLIKPWERMASQQGNVDWFCFWLKGEVDPDPGKREQYERWRKLENMKPPAEPASPRTPS